MINDDEGFSLNDLGQNETSKTPEKSSKKKIVILIAISVTFIILISIIIFLLLRGNTNSSSDSSSEDGIDESRKIGEINCQYRIEDSSKEVPILSETFQKTSDFEIFINKKKVEYTTKYKFEKANTASVQFVLYEDISMDNMFKGIKELSSVIMISIKGGKVKSMESTFESCSNIKDFTINGFDLDELKSTKKMFYNTGLSILNLKIPSLKNIEDMSYMFASSQI